MIFNNKIREKLLKLKNEAEKMEEFAEFKIFHPDELEGEQVGYSIDKDGNSLVSNEEGAWKSEWIVVGYEILCGDPIIIETNQIGYPVSSLMHGMGDWDSGIYLSDSLDKFTDGIIKINQFISEKSMANVVPRITCKDLDNLIKEIIKEDEYGDFDNWKSMLDPIYESTKEYEDNLTKRVKKLSEGGLIIKEISDRLNMSIKDTYKYLRRDVEV
ncbi:hypothetical protein [Clostridium omnivorum]|uniref:Uncharacterized protein n=1 Tax=Clostridium omnivorum TaxID=1604902 RepID=A0ABQ5N7R2_9CLOT|nr:hypothetical protein [Clostridium sp. E14]GLC31176.1 hypothetical protein bsdE14_25860 [Clostridium sp. E14]